LGIKGYVPAYLDPNLKSSDLLTGVGFASGASGYDPLTPKIAVNNIYFKLLFSLYLKLIIDDIQQYIYILFCCDMHGVVHISR
jgi:hypothetical protein